MLRHPRASFVRPGVAASPGCGRDFAAVGLRLRRGGSRLRRFAGGGRPRAPRGGDAV